MARSGLDELLRLATDLASRAADCLLEGLEHERSFVGSKSAASDIVTDADLRAERLIVEHLRKARPADGIIAEESGSSAGTSGLTWIIDPLDGTANYLNRLSPFGVSVAACTAVNGLRLTPIVGVLAIPLQREVFAAVANEGATLNGNAIARPSHTDLQTAIIGTGFSHTPAVRAAEAQLLLSVLPRIGDLRRSGSAACDLCSVAAGRLQGFYQANLKPWDFAAAQLIVSESGGWFSLLGGVAGDGETVAAGAAGLRDSLTTILEGEAVS